MQVGVLAVLIKIVCRVFLRVKLVFRGLRGVRSSRLDRNLVSTHSR
jgi:hypothetical protein